jgi:hypothetical protein
MKWMKKSMRLSFPSIEYRQIPHKIDPFSEIHFQNFQSKNTQRFLRFSAWHDLWYDIIELPTWKFQNLVGAILRRMMT